MWPIVVLAIPLVVVISIVWTRFRGAPWVPTPMHVVHAMLSLAEAGPEDVVYDLGCGDGRMIVAAARDYGARAVGVEISPLRYLWCQIRVTVLGLRDRVRVVYGDFFALDLGEASVVTCFLLQETNDKLESKFRRELRPGARIVSKWFSFPGLHLLRWDGPNRLYLYDLEDL